jgi:uncharacterized protein (DUF169 family)
MSSIRDRLGLSSSPVAVGFFEAPPAGVARWDGGAVPAGCSFWRQAMNGKTFYTQASDHYNCAVGSHTHGIALPAERAGELMETVGFMVSSQYLDMSEVPGIPVHKGPNAVVAYAPLDEAPFSPHAVICAANPGTAMILYEAALRSGAGDGLTPTLGRPGCASIPLAESTGKAVLSFGCKGNRTFTELSGAELYFVVPGAAWPKVEAQIETVLAANETMTGYYEAKKSQFPIL